jgi:PAS domain S-box-containing protein
MAPVSNLVRLPSVPALSWDDCRLLVESVVDYAIFMLDVEGRVATWNLGAEKIKGYKASEIIGAHFSKFFPPEDIAAGKPETELERARDDGRFEDEGWRVRKDGSRLWANVVTTALRDDQGKLRGYAKVTRDLTARRNAEERFRRAEERFHRLVDAVTDYAIYVLDLDGRVLTWNSGAERIKGYRADEIVGQHFSQFYTLEDQLAQKPAQVLDTVRQAGRFEEENWRVRRDGSRFWASVVVTSLYDDAGQLIGFAKVTRDLSERRKAAEEKQHLEQRFKLLLENVADYAIYMLDNDGRVTTWNLGAERMKGYSAAEILGQSFDKFFPDEDRVAGKPAQELALARKSGRHEDEGWRVRKDGTRFWANAILTALHDHQGNLVGFAKITRDLTARRAAEENSRKLLREQTALEVSEREQARLRESDRQAQVAAQAAAEAAERAAEAARDAAEASRLKDEFLATVSHELRTPLNAILGWATLLKDRVFEEAVRKPLEVIHRNAQSQVKIIDDILDMSRVINGKFKIEPRPAELVAIVRDALEVVRPSALAKKIDLRFAPDSEPGLLVADPERLRQVIWNLLSNSIKFTEPGGTVEVSVRQEGSELSVRITDTGQGIDPAFLPFVFDRFRQADSSTTRRIGGLGLGLALVRHIVELHGGRVTAASEGLGKGSLFKVTLPIRAVATTAPSPPAARDNVPPPTPETVSLQGLRVLVVDDEADARDLIATVLMEAGAEVETARSAAEGFELFRQARPDVLISDIGMPDEDGFSFIARIRALSPADAAGVPALALTAFAREEDQARALRAGFTAHLGKPVEPAVLAAAVLRLSRRGREQ